MTSRCGSFSTAFARTGSEGSSTVSLRRGGRPVSGNVLPSFCACLLIALLNRGSHFHWGEGKRPTRRRAWAWGHVGFRLAGLGGVIVIWRCGAQGTPNASLHVGSL